VVKATAIWSPFSDTFHLRFDQLFLFKNHVYILKPTLTSTHSYRWLSSKYLETNQFVLINFPPHFTLSVQIKPSPLDQIELKGVKVSTFPQTNYFNNFTLCASLIKFLMSPNWHKPVHPIPQRSTEIHGSSRESTCWWRNLRCSTLIPMSHHPYMLALQIWYSTLILTNPYWHYH